MQLLDRLQKLWDVWMSRIKRQLHSNALFLLLNLHTKISYSIVSKKYKIYDLPSCLYAALAFALL